MGVPIVRTVLSIASPMSPGGQQRHRLVVATWLGQLLLLILNAASDATRRAI